MKKISLQDIEFRKFFAILFAFLITIKIYDYMDGRPSIQRKHNIRILKQPIDISEGILIGDDGKEYGLVAGKGKMQILAFWAPWCKICASEFPDMDKASLKLAENGINIIPITKPSEDPVKIKTFFETLKISNLVNYSCKTTTIGVKLGVRGYPMFFLVDEKGMAIASMRPQWDEDDILEAIESVKGAQ